MFALNLLCVWFASQLFFNEKTTFLTFSALARIRPDRLIFVFLVSYVLLWWGRQRQVTRLKMVKEEILMLCFFGVLLTSCLVSAVGPLNYHLSTVFTFIGFPMFTFWLCRRLPFRTSNISRLLMVMIGIGGYLGLCGVFEHYDWPHFIFPDYIFDPSVGIHYGRSRGPFVQAAAFGGVLSLIALMTGWFIKNVGATVINWMVLGLMIASIYLSDTRAAWLDFAIGVFILAVTHNRMQRYAYSTVLILAAVFVSGVFSKFSLYETTLFNRRDDAAQSRVVLANASIALIKQRPLLGSGYGTFATSGNDVSLDAQQRRLIEGEGNHNTFLGLLVEVGIVGTLPFVLIMCGFLLQGVRLWRLSRNHSPPARDFAIAVLAALIGYLFLVQFGDVRFLAFLNSLLFAIYGFVFAWTKHLQEHLARSSELTPAQGSNRAPLRPIRRTIRGAAGAA
jgi:O-antigen ligase